MSIENKVITTHELARLLLDFDDLEVSVVEGFKPDLIESKGLVIESLRVKKCSYNEKRPKGVVGEKWLSLGELK